MDCEVQMGNSYWEHLALAFVMAPKGPPQFNNDYQVFFSDENPQLKSFLSLTG